ncbi:MAG TPA: hypothetical protein VNT52_00645, partial [Acidimicrobiales bacterium]|nr:hypothetical protein [Acidimicrobiales bacterium]
MREVAALATLVVGVQFARLALRAAWRESSPLGRALAPYTLDGPGTDAGAERQTRRQAVLRAIDASAPAVDRARVLERVQARLDDAEVPLRAAEALAGTAGAAAVLSVVTLLATGSLP